MDKEKVTEELVRQNGNQAAAVMADYAGQGGGGSTSGIPTIGKNTQANLVFRDPTEEDAAKFNSRPIVKVIDLPNGEIPLYGIIAGEGAETGGLAVFPVMAVSTPVEGQDGEVIYGPNNRLLLSEDWTLLGIMAEGGGGGSE